jgi:uncharacterized protein YodC (DUF2158 family)
MVNIKSGDIVWLKNGGPSMTVYGLLKSNRYAKCNWFDGDKLISDIFNIEQLTDKDPSQTITPKDD